jgi:hypothetical protein
MSKLLALDRARGRSLQFLPAARMPQLRQGWRKTGNNLPEFASASAKDLIWNNIFSGGQKGAFRKGTVAKSTAK